jgi:hypothetical protein
MDQNEQPDRQLNMHFTPEEMAGHYANFANVSHSDSESPIPIARVDHEFDGPEIPGVVVSRINLSPQFMGELLDAMQDNWDKFTARESIRDLPEVDADHPEA